MRKTRRRLYCVSYRTETDYPIFATSVGNAVYKFFRFNKFIHGYDKPETDKDSGGWKGVSVQLG